jgi:HD-GYP domain-containing protein (c-di-GMP phosphodiesterase class II)
VGLLHDVGKMGIRDEINFKPGPLTASEFAQVQNHTIEGERILSQVKSLAHLCPVIRSHHERYDGTGYPDGLAGEQIPQMARIIAVADSCVAMASSRRYRPALTPARIERVIQEGAGTQWDPLVTAVFMTCREEVYALWRARGARTASPTKSIARSSAFPVSSDPE